MKLFIVTTLFVPEEIVSRAQVFKTGNALLLKAMGFT